MITVGVAVSTSPPIIPVISLPMIFSPCTGLEILIAALFSFCWSLFDAPILNNCLLRIVIPGPRHCSDTLIPFHRVSEIVLSAISMLEHPLEVLRLIP